MAGEMEFIFPTFQEAGPQCPQLYNARKLPIPLGCYENQEVLLV